MQNLVVVKDLSIHLIIMEYDFTFNLFLCSDLVFDGNKSVKLAVAGY